MFVCLVSFIVCRFFRSLSVLCLLVFVCLVFPACLWLCLSHLVGFPALSVSFSAFVFSFLSCWSCFWLFSARFQLFVQLVFSSFGSCFLFSPPFLSSAACFWFFSFSSCFLLDLLLVLFSFRFSGFFLKSNAKFCPSPQVRFLTQSYQPLLVVNFLPTHIVTKSCQTEIEINNWQRTLINVTLFLRVFEVTKLAGGPRARTRKAMERTVSSVFPNNQEISWDAENVNVQSARPR